MAEFKTWKEKKAFKQGFFAGLYKKKGNGATKIKPVGYSSVKEIPVNYQHNVLMSDSRYIEIRRNLDNDPNYYKTGSAFNADAVSLYKKKYGDSFLKRHYGIKK